MKQPGRQTEQVSVRLTVQTADRLRTWAQLAQCRQSEIMEAALTEWMQAMPDTLAMVESTLQRAEQLRATLPADISAPATAPKKYSKVTPEEVQRMQELSLTGMTCPEIARTVGRPYSTVLDTLHREGHLPRDARYKQGEEE